MTVLGQHTVAETEELMKTVEFRIQAGNKVNAQITMQQISANPDLYKDIQTEWNGFQVRWATGRDDILLKLFVRNQSNLLVSKSLVTSEPEFIAVQKLINANFPGPYGNGDLMDVLTRIEKFAGQTIDEKDKPMPAGFDPDLLAYKKVDDQIKAGEAAAKAAADSAASAAKKLPWWVWGVGIVGAGIAAKVYIGPFIPSPHKRKEL